MEREREVCLREVEGKGNFDERIEEIQCVDKDPRFEKLFEI